MATTGGAQLEGVTMMKMMLDLCPTFVHELMVASFIPTAAISGRVGVRENDQPSIKQYISIFESRL